MATADLKLVYGSGGGFTPSFFSGRLSIPSTSSGVLLTLTAPAGKRVRLTSLITTAPAGEPNISISADGVPVVTALTLTNGGNAANGNFSVGYPHHQSPGQGAGDIEYIQANNSIVITKTTGSIGAIIGYSYAYGE
jgi:hypothetical protein